MGRRWPGVPAPGRQTPERRFSVALSLGLALVLCARLGAAVPSGMEDAQATMDGNAQFAMALYQEISRAEPGNVFISPWSISCALVVAQAGAAGATAAEISQTAHFSPSQDSLRRGFVFVNQRLQETADQDECTLRRATAMWCHHAQPVRAAFVEFCAAAVGAKVMDARFGSDAINEWVGQQTMGKIQQVIEPSDLHDFSRLVLVNALYFKGRWQRQFAVESTRPGPFTLDSGASVEVPMMRGEHDTGYAFYRGAQVLQLPYHGGGVVMLVVLPTAGSRLSSLEQGLSLEWLKGCYGSLKPSTVDVTLPAFTLNYRLNLNSTLQRLGMRKAFGDEADFSGIDGNRTNSLFIDAVLHQAYVEVNEQGTEAAAATVDHFARSAVLPVKFVCDRPFLFVIRAVKAGTILFIGRVNDPSQPAARPRGI
jgi:serpin B